MMRRDIGRVFIFLVFSALTFLSTGLPGPAVAAAEENTDGGAAVMQEFHKLADDEPQVNEFSTEEKHQVLFIMGVLLLVLLLITAVLGVSMGLHGKQVFVPHMVFAGLSVTLAIAHSVVAIVWFYPF